jgi:hypothetical protein
VFDDAVYRRNSINETIVTHVDDFLLAEPDKASLIAVANSLKNDVKLNILGDVDWFFGVRVRRFAGNGDVSLDLDQYLVKALEACDFGEGRVVSTFFEPGMLAETVPYADKATPEEITAYASMVGKFIFSLCQLKPDTAFATSIWARFMSNLSPAHLAGLKRVLRYLRGCTQKSIRYRPLENHPHKAYNDLGLLAAIDASYASNPEDSRSMTGYVFFMGGAPVLWRSHRQSVIAKATASAEYMAASEAAKEAAWMRNFLTELGHMPEGPITMLCDSTSAKKWTKDTAINKKKKHIRLHYHYVRQKVICDHIRLE